MIWWAKAKDEKKNKKQKGLLEIWRFLWVQFKVDCCALQEYKKARRNNNADEKKKKNKNKHRWTTLCALAV